jgi:hypothetical protein
MLDRGLMMNHQAILKGMLVKIIHRLPDDINGR